MTKKYVYHVTFFNRLSKISEIGLVPIVAVDDGKAMMGRSGFGRGKGAKLYLTCAEGIQYWYDVAAAIAVSMEGDSYQEGYTPVVLRVRHPVVLGSDNEGSSLADAPAYTCDQAISPEVLELWNGFLWVSISETVTLFVDCRQAYSSPDGTGYRKFLPIRINNLANVEV